jgi:hypothetical protein
VPPDLSLLSGVDCANLDAFVTAMQEDRVLEFIDEVKTGKLVEKTENIVEKSKLCGVFYDGKHCFARVRVQDVTCCVKTFKVPFPYPSDRDAAIAYDYVTVHFCNLVGQRVKHKLNFPSETIASRQQIELKLTSKRSLPNHMLSRLEKLSHRCAY